MSRFRTFRRKVGNVAVVVISGVHVVAAAVDIVVAFDDGGCVAAAAAAVDIVVVDGGVADAVVFHKNILVDVNNFFSAAKFSKMIPLHFFSSLSPRRNYSRHLLSPCVLFSCF